MSSKPNTRYSPRKLVNLYRAESMELWDDVERTIRSEYDAEDASEGEIAAQAFAECLGRDGPLEREQA